MPEYPRGGQIVGEGGQGDEHIGDSHPCPGPFDGRCVDGRFALLTGVLILLFVRHNVLLAD